MKSSKTATKHPGLSQETKTAPRSHKTRHLPLDQVHLLGHLVTHVAHRLRSPMGAVSGYSELLHKSSSDPGKMQGYAGMITASVDELNRILSEMEIFSVVNKASLSKCRTQEIIANVHTQFTRTELQRLQWNGPAHNSEIQTDILLMQRVLTELIRNALQMAKPVETPVQITWNKHTIHISNQGHAIPDHVADRIFLPFIGTNPRQMGLGLTIAHYFCSLMNYSLKLVSNSNEEGITFEIGITSLNLRKV